LSLALFAGIAAAATCGWKHDHTLDIAMATQTSTGPIPRQGHFTHPSHLAAELRRA